MEKRLPVQSDRSLVCFISIKNYGCSATVFDLAGAYLLIPFTGVVYLKLRWYVASSFERVLCTSWCSFLSGLLLLGPFVNFRPSRRQIQGKVMMSRISSDATN